jgi:molybdopterin converting factor small subunit
MGHIRVKFKVKRVQQLSCKVYENNEFQYFDHTGTKTAVQDGDELAIIPAVAGGHQA